MQCELPLKENCNYKNKQVKNKHSNALIDENMADTKHRIFKIHIHTKCLALKLFVKPTLREIGRKREREGDRERERRKDVKSV